MLPKEYRDRITMLVQSEMNYFYRAINERDNSITRHIARTDPKVISEANCKIIEAEHMLIRVVADKLLGSIEQLGVPNKCSLEKDCIDEAKYFIQELIKRANYPDNPAAIASCESMLMAEVEGKIRVYARDKLRINERIIEKQKYQKDSSAIKERQDQPSPTDIKKWNIYIKSLGNETIKRRLSVLLLHIQGKPRSEIEKSHPGCNISRDIKRAKKHVQEIREKRPDLVDLS
ncbi:hypothetical protein EPN96_11635 [bacterium]|nr:MAG: hypothetical protein EPN96_11635 [bacterium]